MHRYRVVAALFLLVSFFTSTASRASKPQDPLAIRVDKLITNRYYHGVPFDSARALGSKAVPILASRLRDPKFRGFEPEICTAICMIGAPEGYPILRAFIWDPGKNDDLKVDSRRACLAETVAQSGMGLIARHSDEALEYLLQSTSPAYWDSLPLRCDRDIPRDFVEGSITTLPFTERPQARAHLVKLSEAGSSEYIRSSARNAVIQFDEVKKLGADEYLRQLQRRLR